MLWQGCRERDVKKRVNATYVVRLLMIRYVAECGYVQSRGGCRAITLHVDQQRYPRRCGTQGSVIISRLSWLVGTSYHDSTERCGVHTITTSTYMLNPSMVR